MAKQTLFWLLLSVAALVFRPVQAVAADPAPDLTRQPTLYVVGYAHLDTEWRWEYPQVIDEYIVHTMRDNFALFEKYPHYIFNFSGSNRYRFMKEYFPADFAKVKQYVNSGRWFPAGSSVEEGDVNAPSAEGIVRQVLYGNNWFRKELGTASAEYMLPDCFGFPASLPSILAHAGVKGFSTQKLVWGSSADGGGVESMEKTPVGTPFDVGVWVGPDGKTVLAGINPGDYSADITTDLTTPLPAPAGKLTDDQALRRYQGDWAARVENNGKFTGVQTDYHYYGTGDIGGSPREKSVKLLEAIVTKGTAQIGSDPNVRVGNGPVHVLSSKADQMFLDITPAEAASLPRFTGEMELTNHSAGSLTSQAYQKRWIRKEELLADGAEKASIAAEWLGARPYPRERLNDAWTLAMGGHFHDIAAGTATPKSYEFAWNDDVIAMNQFAGVMANASEAVAAGLDTQTKGIALVVYNPLNHPFMDITANDPNYLDWARRFADGRPMTTTHFGWGEYYEGCLNSPVREQTMDCVREVITNYPVDLMYYDGAYEGMDHEGDFCHCKYCKEAYAKAHGKEVPKQDGKDQLEDLIEYRQWMEQEVVVAFMQQVCTMVRYVRDVPQTYNNGEMMRDGWTAKAFLIPEMTTFMFEASSSPEEKLFNIRAGQSTGRNIWTYVGSHTVYNREHIRDEEIGGWFSHPIEGEQLQMDAAMATAAGAGYCYWGLNRLF